MKTVVVDFDGVLHSYVSGWQGAEVIPDPPVPGAMRWLVEMMGDGEFEMVVSSTRAAEWVGWWAVRRWLAEHLWHEAECNVVPRIVKPGEPKPPAVLYIDDRAWRFEGSFPSPVEVREFRPWRVR